MNYNVLLCFCTKYDISVTNVTNIFQYLDLTELNLIESEKWWDLISSKDINDIKSTIALKAYQTVWISNIKKH